MHAYKINRLKFEAPLMAAFGIFAIAISLIFFPRILWFSFLSFPLMAGAYLLFKRMNIGLFSRTPFLILDANGMRYCFHIFQQPRILLWSQVEKVNYQLYEINLRLRESGQMISIQVAYLEEASDLKELKETINTYCEVA
jgi:hypothetical protein